MLIIPAIDIIKGKVVRLQQGDFNKEIFYSAEPVEVACTWQRKGATILHLIDLEGARYGWLKNKDTISQVLKSIDIPCEVGGGIRTEQDIEYFLENGAMRVIMGTKAVEEQDYLQKISQKFRDRIAVSIDFSQDEVVKKGWREKTGFSTDEVIKRMQDMGVQRIIVTDISADGMLKGLNIQAIAKVLEVANIPVIVSGGISCLEDIKKLKGLRAENLEGIIIGRALYEGKIILEEAIELGR